MLCARDRTMKMAVSSSALRRVTAGAGRHRLLTAPAVLPQQVGGGRGLSDHRRPASNQHQGFTRSTSSGKKIQKGAAGGGDGGALAAGRGIFTAIGITGRRTLSTTAAPAVSTVAATAPRYIVLDFVGTV